MFIVRTVTLFAFLFLLLLVNLLTVLRNFPMFAADHDVDMDVSRMVVPIGVSPDDGGMTGEVFFAEFQAKCLCLFHGQAVVGCISGVEADDILMALNIIALDT